MGRQQGHSGKGKPSGGRDNKSSGKKHILNGNMFQKTMCLIRLQLQFRKHPIQMKLD